MVSGSLPLYRKLEVSEYWNADVGTENKAGNDHDIRRGQEAYVNNLLHWFQPWRSTKFFQ